MILGLFRFPPNRRLPVDKEEREPVCCSGPVSNIVVEVNVLNTGEQSESKGCIQSLSTT